jgi:hypothetical protein
VLVEEAPGDVQAIPQGTVAHAQLVTEAGVVVDERMVVLGRPPGDGRRHRPITARAAAYSAATCSLDRCT